MIAANVNNAAATRQVACKTSDNLQVPVDLDVLLLSGTFKKMYEDLGLSEHDAFPGVFPVETVTSRIFEKVIDWCREHKDEPVPVIEKDTLTRECKWFEFTDYDRTLFDVPAPEVFELIMAADYLDISRLYHYACQAVAACIKGKHPIEICEALFDLDDAQIRKARDDNPWFDWPGAFPGAPMENAVFVPNEVLVTIFEKLPREALERLQLISTQFDDVIESSSELSEQQGPRRVVTKVEFGTYSEGLFTQQIHVWLRDGTRVTCTDFENLAMRLKFTVVQELRFYGWYRGVSNADIENLSKLLPVKAAWKSARVEASMSCFSSQAVFEFVFTQLLLCKKIILCEESESFSWSRSFMRLPAIAACNKLDMSELSSYGTEPADVVEWLEHEAPPETQWSEPWRLILYEDRLNGDINGLLTALKTAFLASSSAKPYVVRIFRFFHHGNLNEAFANKKTHERLTIRASLHDDVVVQRA